MADRPTIHVQLSPRATGDECPEANCCGRLFAYKSVPNGEVRIRYLKCDTCRKVPESNKQRVPEAFIARRRKRSE